MQNTHRHINSIDIDSINIIGMSSCVNMFGLCPVSVSSEQGSYKWRGAFDNDTEG